MREAFYVARAERKPVVLSVPDLQTEEFPYLPDYTPSTDLMPRAQVLRPDPAVIDEIVAMVAEAERPIVIGGRGALWSGAKDALESLAQESGALLATTLLGKGLFDGNPFALDIAGTFATDLGREFALRRPEPARSWQCRAAARYPAPVGAHRGGWRSR